LEGGEESEGLKHQFLQVEKDLDFFLIPKLITILNKKAPWKEVIMVKDED